MASPDEVKAVIARGVKSIPNSVKLWIRAAELEHDKAIKSKVLRKGLEHIPDSLRLWEAIVDLANEEDARLLFHRAVKCCPLHVKLWLALARMETYENAKKVLNKAKEKLPKEPAIWIAAAKLEEANGNTAMVGKIIERGIRRVYKKGVSIETARAIYAHALTIFLTKKSIWLKAALLEKKHGTRESVDAILRKAITSRTCHRRSSEEIWLAAFKLEFENHEPERARMLLVKVQERGGTERVWMKAAIVEGELGNTAEERRLLEEGLQRFPSFFKLWLMLAQLEHRLGHLNEGRQAYESGLKHCPSYCIPLCLALASLEENMNGLGKARAVLTMARKKNPKKSESIELRHANKKEAKALQECPTSGIIWAESIEMAPKRKSSNAYIKCNHDPFVRIGRLILARRLLDRAVCVTSGLCIIILNFSMGMRRSKWMS
ncbi:hypothetical protein IFM89_029511 [Coptis chinensis]|uniref:Pre-mRNA splicing factor n=1 Tax=Coptis chinensis TaxID=261450 RepID=A0A835HZD1_9MAGN|nr:hypothetical protein IFM89_029511 [Coptis chinensis]